MLNRTFVIRSNELPEEMKSWEWGETERYGNHPQVPCVVIIARISYGVVIPYQISETINLRKFLQNYKNIGVTGNMGGNTVFYVIEKNDAERTKKKEALQNLFNVYGVI
ncbi:hypothetical protein [Paenibacillus polymyxa]|uniref:hypothetical protein n=1 Tax=Paenibacillus polymyxa TaxID=1406 RepID=UPI002379C30C|nr:hypothetical protein [Paenibacillus polymyxa]WDM23795.1 hypothetical protein J4I02_10060 [Paenibacillus polymyxa]